MLQLTDVSARLSTERENYFPFKDNSLLSSASASAAYSSGIKIWSAIVSNNQGDPPALPGRQQKCDGSGSHAEAPTMRLRTRAAKHTDEIPSMDVVRAYEQIGERRKDTTRD
jgi:hypothetical protein